MFKFSRKQFFIVVCASILAIALLSSIFIAVTDETNWVSAGQDFKDAIIQLRPDKTYVPLVSHRLGVSVLWVSSITYIFFGSLPSNYLTIIHRFVFLVINLSLFGGALIILRRYTQTLTLILFTVYMFLNRFFPIIGRSTWLDQFLTIFAFLSILFWTKFLFTKKKSNLIIAAVFNGLVLLTKYAGWYFPLIIIGISVIYCIKTKEKTKKIDTTFNNIFKHKHSNIYYFVSCFLGRSQKNILFKIL